LRFDGFAAMVKIKKSACVLPQDTALAACAALCAVIRSAWLGYGPLTGERADNVARGKIAKTAGWIGFIFC
jgi:hypothetical protein